MAEKCTGLGCNRGFRGTFTVKEFLLNGLSQV